MNYLDLENGSGGVVGGSTTQRFKRYTNTYGKRIRVEYGIAVCEMVLFLYIPLPLQDLYIVIGLWGILLN